MMKLFQKIMLAVVISVLFLQMNKAPVAEAKVLSPLTLDFQDQSFQFRDSGEGLVSFDAVTIKKKKGEVTLSWNKKARWDTYDVSDDSRVVDLSSRSTTKDILVATMDVVDATPIVFWVPADTSRYKGKYESGRVNITDSNKQIEDETIKFEYRTANGEWKDYNPSGGVDFSKYEQQGATLYFRRKAVNVGSMGYTSGDSQLRQEDRGYVTTVIKAKQSYFASREFKVKIPKRSYAPSISVDYNWQTIKVKDTMEYRAKDYHGQWVNGLGNGEWTEVPSGVKELKMEDLFKADGVMYETIVEIRTKADPGKKRSASKPCILKFPSAMHFLSNNFGLINKYGIQGQAPELPERGLIFKLLRRKGKNYCRFINVDPEFTYEIYAEDPFENKKAAKIAVVKPNTELEVSSKKAPEQKSLYVLIAADKSKKRFRSRATACGSVNMIYPTEDTE